jgi:hypothetical protein
VKLPVLPLAVYNLTVVLPANTPVCLLSVVIMKAVVTITAM